MEQACKDIGTALTASETDLARAQHMREKTDTVVAEQSRLNRELDEAMQRMGSVSDHVRTNVDRLVSSIQFHDLSNQLIGHVIKRTDTIDGVLRTFAEVLEKNGDPQARISVLRSRIDELCRRLPAPSVVQANLSTGSVDLF